MNGIVYYTFNLKSGKGYVGKHCKPFPDGRFRAHSRSSSLIGNAMRKHGIENFRVVILHKGTSDEELFRAEIFWIDRLETLHPFGYNLHFGGIGVSGIIPHELSRLANSLAHKDVPWSEARRKTHKPTKPGAKRLKSDQLSEIRANPNWTKWDIARIFNVSERVARDAKNQKGGYSESAS